MTAVVRATPSIAYDNVFTIILGLQESMIAIIDNYDSFTYNLVQTLGLIDQEVDIEVYRNDQITVDELASLSPSHLILSPGPCTPNEAGISVQCVEHFHGQIPILGVCLGHQSIGQATGGTIVPAKKLMHGKTDQIHHDDQSLFQGLPNPMVATRYHSLVIKKETLNDEFLVSAWTDEKASDGEIMAISHRSHPTFGVQFHPESVLTPHGKTIIKNWIEG